MISDGILRGARVKGAAVGLIAAVAGSANADFSFMVLGSATSPIANELLAAKATISFVNATDTLTILLENTAPNAVANQGNTLSGFFWSIVGTPTVTKVSAALNGGSQVVLNNVPQFGDNLNDHWGYKSGINNYIHDLSLTYGISAVGLGIFSPSNTFSGTGPSLDGTDFDLIPSAGTTGSPSVNSTKYVNNKMLFTFSTTANLSQADLRAFAFQYGSDLSEPRILVPEPASMTAMGVALLGFLRLRRRK